MSSEKIRRIALDAGLPETTTVEYSRTLKRYDVRPFPHLGAPPLKKSAFVDLDEAQTELPAQATAWLAAYGRVPRLWTGAQWPTGEEMKLLLACADRTYVTSALQHEQLVAEGWVERVPALRAKQAPSYKLTPFGEALVRHHRAALEAALIDHERDPVNILARLRHAEGVGYGLSLTHNEVVALIAILSDDT